MSASTPLLWFPFSKGRYKSTEMNRIVWMIITVAPPLWYPSVILKPAKFYFPYLEYEDSNNICLLGLRIKCGNVITLLKVWNRQTHLLLATLTVLLNFKPWNTFLIKLFDINLYLSILKAYLLKMCPNHRYPSSHRISLFWVLLLFLVCSHWWFKNSSLKSFISPLFIASSENNKE